jgi:hypothetical protein
MEVTSRDWDQALRLPVAGGMRGWGKADNRLASLYMPSLGASWRNGYAEDCKSLHPGSIPGEASIFHPAV